MQIGDIITCDTCGAEITLDAFDLEEGEAFCLVCGEETEIEEEESVLD